MALDHTLCAGATQTGKTTMMKRLSWSSRQRLIVYDPMASGAVDETGWRRGLGGWMSHKQTAVTTNPTDLMLMASRYNNCDIFVDEAADVFSLRQPENHWLLTKGRHLGHQVYIASQRPTMIAPNVRQQVSSMYLYRLAHSDLRDVLADAGISVRGIDEHYFPRHTGEYLHIDFREAKVHFIKENADGLITQKDEVDWRIK